MVTCGSWVVVAAPATAVVVAGGVVAVVGGGFAIVCLCHITSQEHLWGQLFEWYLHLHAGTTRDDVILRQDCSALASSLI